MGVIFDHSKILEQENIPPKIYLIKPLVKINNPWIGTQTELT